MQKEAGDVEDLVHAFTQFLAENSGGAQVTSRAESMAADGKSVESLCRNAFNG